MSNTSANWHWKQKDISPWSKEWLKTQLAECSTPELKVKSVSPEGDATVGMRKSKVVTIYDFKVTCTWTSTGEDAIEGELIAVEVSHDMEEDDYTFEVSCGDSSPEATKLKEVARKQLADQMRPIFQQLPKEMVKLHGKDLLVNANQSTPSGSGTSTPVPEAPKPAAAPAAPKVSKPSNSQSINTTSVSIDSSFMISASDLFELLTDASKVPMWTRNQATIKAEAGSEVSLFGGNITGKMMSVDKPGKFVMSWRAPGWPEGHHGTLTATLEQGSSDTKLLLKLEGVPLGKEEETERNLDIYYIRSLKQIGYAAYPFLKPSPCASPVPRPPPPLFAIVAFAVAVASLLYGLFWRP